MINNSLKIKNLGICTAHTGITTGCTGEIYIFSIITINYDMFFVLKKPLIFW